MSRRIEKKTMKALSLKQPWANLIAEGKKTIETRKWSTKYRGDLVICSSLKPKIKPYGSALCMVELYNIEPMRQEHEKEACIGIYKGAYSWFLRNLRKIDPVFPIHGQLGIYDLEIPDGVLI